MEPSDFLRLLVNSKCLIGNSSAGIRECAFLGVPVVNIGTRQNKRERGFNTIDVDYNRDEIITATRNWLKSERPKSCDIYGGGNAGSIMAEKLAEIELKFHKTITF